MPTDWGFMPPIEVLPQIAQARAMVRKDSDQKKTACRTAPPSGYYSTTPGAERAVGRPAGSGEEMDERVVGAQETARDTTPR